MSYINNIGGGEIGKTTPDNSVFQVRNSNLSQISTIDFFYPNVEDPYIQGRIACCNVLSDLYAMGVEDIDCILMVLGISLKMNEKQREVVTSLMMQGFDDCAKQAGTSVTGGQTIFNPWPIIGGVAISVLGRNEFIMPNDAEVGDVIVMTKALGTQLCSNSMQWLKSRPERWQKVENIISKEEVYTAFDKANDLMSTLNLSGAILMKKYKARASTDITGFGVQGHANLLASCQKNKVDFKIHTLPIIKNMLKIDKIVNNFRLIEGYSAETSGGLLVCLPKDQAEAFVKEMREKYEMYANIVGEVVEGSNKAYIVQNPKIIEIE